MLEYVGNTGRISRYGLETNTKCIFFIFITDMKVFGAGAGMLEQVEKRVDFLKLDNSLNNIAQNIIAFTQIRIIFILF